MKKQIVQTLKPNIIIRTTDQQIRIIEDKKIEVDDGGLEDEDTSLFMNKKAEINKLSFDESIDLVNASIEEICNKIGNRLLESSKIIKPQKVELEFGITLGTGVNVYIWSGKGEVNFRIKFIWET